MKGLGEGPEAIANGEGAACGGDAASKGEGAGADWKGLPGMVVAKGVFPSCGMASLFGFAPSGTVFVWGGAGAPRFRRPPVPEGCPDDSSSLLNRLLKEKAMLDDYGHVNFERIAANSHSHESEDTRIFSQK